jgi:hypothetical protein
LAYFKPDFEKLAYLEVVWLIYFLENKPACFWLISGLFEDVWLIFQKKNKPDFFLLVLAFFLAFFGVIWLIFGKL